MQNVVFKPKTLETWVSNAGFQKNETGKACNQKWYYFNFGEELRKRKWFKEELEVSIKSLPEK